MRRKTFILASILIGMWCIPLIMGKKEQSWIIKRVELKNIEVT